MRIVDLEKVEPQAKDMRWARQYAPLFLEFNLRPVGYQHEMGAEKYYDDFIYALGRMYAFWKMND